MAEQTAPEPTMEEILASIRRIISDDDAPIADAPSAAADDGDAAGPALVKMAPAVAAVATVAESEMHDEDGDDEDVLELTEPASPAPAERPLARFDTSASDEPLVSEPAAAEAASSFGRLSAAAARPPAMAMPAPGRTLEDVTADLLRPMLKAWLDENLGDIVQQRVDEEVQRIARGRVR